MKIKKLVVKNYKVFDHLELDFTDKNGGVLDTIVLAGLNGSGKTTVLEIIKKVFDGSIYDYFKNRENGFIEIELELTLEEKIRGQKTLLNFEGGKSFSKNSPDLIETTKCLYFSTKLNDLESEKRIKDSIIMVDTPENALHPTKQQMIVKLYQNIGENNQVILATHSPQILASVYPKSVFVLTINDETHKVVALNMADEHKYTYGVEPNRILSEIMGTPIRNFETQQRINAILGLIKSVEFDPSVSGVSKVEKAIDLLAEDLGKQDASIMRFRNELRLLNRKLLVAQ